MKPKDVRGGQAALSVVLLLTGAWLVSCRTAEAPPASQPPVRAASRPPATSEVRKGEELLAKGDVKGAWALFEEAIALDSRNARAWLDLGLVYEEVGDWSAAEKAYRRATEIDGNFAEAFNNLGVLLRERNDLEGAIEMLERAARLDPTFAPAHYNLALAYEDHGDLQRAEVEYLASIRLLPDDAVPRINLAMLYLELGRPIDARSQLSSAAPLVRDDVLLSVAVGSGLRRSGAPEDAVDVLRRALELAPERPPTDLLAELALASYASGDLRSAESVMGQAVDQRPDDAALRYAFGAILAKKGSTDRARQELRQVIRLDPDGPYADKARALLRAFTR